MIEEEKCENKARETEIDSHYDDTTLVSTKLEND